MISKILKTGLVIIISLYLQSSYAYSQIFEKYDSTFLQAALWNPVQIAPDDIDVLGLRLDLLYGENRDLYGLDLGLINSLTRDLAGVQIGAANFTRCEMYGLQIGIDNVVGTLPPFGLDYLLSTPETVIACGLQVGALNMVYPRGELFGAQVGIINVLDKGTGLQLGIVNCANDLTGIQIGLLNYNEAAEFYLTPFINACF